MDTITTIDTTEVIRLHFQDTSGDGSPDCGSKLGKRNTWDRQTISWIRQLDGNGVPEGQHGHNGERWTLVTATLRDGSAVDVTDQFIAAGWALWRHIGEICGEL